jgi:hypothetical protein
MQNWMTLILPEAGECGKDASRNAVSRVAWHQTAIPQNPGDRQTSFPLEKQNQFAYGGDLLITPSRYLHRRKYSVSSGDSTLPLTAKDRWLAGDG